MIVQRMYSPSKCCLWKSCSSVVDVCDYCHSLFLCLCFVGAAEVVLHGAGGVLAEGALGGLDGGEEGGGGGGGVVGDATSLQHQVLTNLMLTWMHGNK